MSHFTEISMSKHKNKILSTLRNGKLDYFKVFWTTPEKSTFSNTGIELNDILLVFTNSIVVFVYYHFKMTLFLTMK